MKVWLNRGSNGRRHVVMYAHGSCLSNGNDPYAAAGAAYFFGFNNKHNGSCAVSGRQTNQRAQLTAVLEGLKVILQYSNINCAKVRTNSDYVVNAMEEWIYEWENNGWRTAKREDVANQDLIRELHVVRENFDNVDWELLDADSQDKHYLVTVYMSNDEAQRRVN